MRRLLDAGESIAALLLLLIALLVAVNVLLRDLFAVQIPDWFDFTRMLQLIALFWGVAIATYRGGHIAVDIVWEHLGQRGKRLLELVSMLFVLLLLAPMAWMIWNRIAVMGTQATSDLRVPLVYFFTIGAIGATAAAVLALVRLWELARGS
jgi:TRAP-type transport system small permease protein